MQNEPVELLNSPRCIIGGAHGDEAETTRAIGLMSKNQRHVTDEADEAHPLVVHNHNLGNIAISRKLILEIGFASTDG